MSKPSEASGSIAIRHQTSRSLIKQIFEAEHPEQFVRTIPAQSLYCAVKSAGLSSCSELIEISTIEQCRLMLDLDCWENWQVREDSLWEWLALTDDSDGLKILQKVARCIDLKIVALLIGRWVDFVNFEEPTDNPPGPGYYTPDKGYTWLTMKIEDGTKQFLLGRLLAMVFENDSDLFYRLLAITNQLTPAELEEEAYQDKSKRLMSEGIPDEALANELNAPIPFEQLKADLKEGGKHQRVVDILPVYPLIYDSPGLQPLSSLFAELVAREEIEAELTFIINGALVRYDVEYYELEQVKLIAEKVKGAINIGLEMCRKVSRHSLAQIYDIVGLQKMYRAGLGRLSELRRKARAVSEGRKDHVGQDMELEAVLALAKAPFPEMPLFLKEDGSATGQEKQAWESSEEQESKNNPVAGRPIESLAELEKVARFIESR
ncbi:MAG: hypothetical protein J5J00_01320 [Deltaproteobacteria bacterium]|nr:hypothetical protein [Deltaproteobacteria bacterium]